MGRAISLLVVLSLTSGLRAEDLPVSVGVAIRYYQLEGKSHSHLYAFDGKAQTVQQLTRDESGQDHDPVFSPSGGSVIPLPDRPVFVGVCDQLYLPLGDDATRFASPSTGSRQAHKGPKHP
jgi:hypothetical protein